MASRGHDIATAVSNIIAAFYSFRETVTRIGKPPASNKSRQRTSSDKTQMPNGKHLSSRCNARALHRLDVCIAKAPLAIQNKYATGFSRFGDRFRTGDDLALAQLTATLVKMNTGLVDVIGSFLDRTSKVAVKPTTKKSATRTNDAPQTGVNYASLAVLSEASRVEACEALTQLSKRLAGRSTIAAAPSQGKPIPTKEPRSSKKTTSKTVVNKQSKPVQYAFIRTQPRPKRRRESSGTVSSAGSKTVVESEPRSSRPMAPGASSAKHRSNSQGKRNTSNEAHHALKAPFSPALSGTTLAASPEAVPLHFDDHHWPKISGGVPNFQVPQFVSHSSAELTASLDHRDLSPAIAGSQGQRPGLISVASYPDVPQRQPSSAARSHRTVATTASTQLGEIPLHRWTEAPDFDEMSALNAVAGGGGNGLTCRAQTSRDQKSARRGFFAKVFRRVPVADVSA